MWVEWSFMMGHTKNWRFPFAVFELLMLMLLLRANGRKLVQRTGKMVNEKICITFPTNCVAILRATEWCAFAVKVTFSVHTQRSNNWHVCETKTTSFAAHSSELAVLIRQFNFIDLQRKWRKERDKLLRLWKDKSTMHKAKTTNNIAYPSNSFSCTGSTATGRCSNVIFGVVSKVCVWRTWNICHVTVIAGTLIGIVNEERNRSAQCEAELSKNRESTTIT